MSSTRGNWGYTLRRPIVAKGNTDHRPVQLTHRQSFLRTTVGATRGSAFRRTQADFRETASADEAYAVSDDGLSPVRGNSGAVSLCAVRDGGVSHLRQLISDQKPRFALQKLQSYNGQCRLLAQVILKKFQSNNKLSVLSPNGIPSIT